MREIGIAGATKAFPSLLNHMTLLDDEVRVGAFQTAIEETVRPGDVVVDVGTGTGILALFAARAGAKRVYAIEKTDLIELAADLARENGLEDRIVFLRGNSLRIALPERADVLVTETLGHIPFEEGILRVVADARRRLLKPGARIIPRRLSTFLVPLRGAFLHRDLVGVWERRAGGLDLSAARRAAAKRIYKGWIGDEEFLAEPRVAWSVRLNAWAGGALGGVMDFPVQRPGLFVGLGGWFEAWLFGRVVINTFRGTTWRNCVFPLETPLEVGKGDRIRLRARLEERRSGYRVRWEGAISGRQSTVRFAHVTG